MFRLKKKCDLVVPRRVSLFVNKFQAGRKVKVNQGLRSNFLFTTSSTKHRFDSIQVTRPHKIAIIVFNDNKEKEIWNVFVVGKP